MTREQYRRWKDFALRMARTVFKDHAHPSGKEIVQMVKDFIGGIDKEDIRCIRDWDNSDHYPKGSSSYSRRYKCPCWHCGTTGKKPDCPYKNICEGGQIYDYAEPYPMCDMMSEWETDNVYYHVRNLMTPEELSAYEKVTDEDRDKSDDMQEAFTEAWCEPLRCCVRAALDLAVAPSAGVMGFTAGDIRAMYPKGVPDWIARQWDDSEIITASAVVPGVGFVPKVLGKGERFENMPDDTSLWL